MGVKRPIGPRTRLVKRVATAIISSNALIAAMPEDVLAITTDADCCEFRAEGVIGYGWVQPQPAPIAHVGEAAFVVGDRARYYVPDIYHACRDMLVAAVYRKSYMRIQCHVPEDLATARWFAERLGFVTEGVKKRFGPGGIDMRIMRLELN